MLVRNISRETKLVVRDKVSFVNWLTVLASFYRFFVHWDLGQPYRTQTVTLGQTIQNPNRETWANHTEPKQWDLGEPYRTQTVRLGQTIQNPNSETWANHTEPKQWDLGEPYRTQTVRLGQTIQHPIKQNIIYNTIPNISSPSKTPFKLNIVKGTWLFWVLYVKQFTVVLIIIIVMHPFQNCFPWCSMFNAEWLDMLALAVARCFPTKEFVITNTFCNFSTWCE